MAISSPDAMRGAGLVAGLLAGAGLAAGAFMLWSTADPAMVAAADRARASADPTREVLVAGTLVPFREGPLFRSPASGQGALAYELTYRMRPPKPKRPDETMVVDREFRAMPLYLRAPDRLYRIVGEVGTIHPSEPELERTVHDGPKRWFPARLRQEFPGRPFLVEEVRLEPGERVAVRGRLSTAGQPVVIAGESGLELWEGGLAPFEKRRNDRRAWAAFTALLAVAALAGPLWWVRRRPADPYAGWKVFR
jgi:hypothetical protein